ncbi:hypothetical protein [Clavibacter zhangzhiyongii]|uniref:hypothetical protein n=1 Tax=Clavibacter zhangzhiyongii TaxID=2768071 RepID=UPI0039E13109
MALALVVALGGAAVTGPAGPAEAATAAAVPFAVAPVPVIAGTASVGATLELQPGSWDPAPDLSFRWWADDVLIPGATGGSLVLRPADLGRRITATVTATRPGYATTSRTSAATARIAARATGISDRAPVVSYDFVFATEQAAVRVLASFDDRGLDVRQRHFEYQLDGSDAWTPVDAQSDSWSIEGDVPLPAGDHVIRWRAVGVLDGVRVVSAASDPQTQPAYGLPLPSTPTATVSGPYITFSYDIREALNGWPLERGTTIVITGREPFAPAEAAGSVTVFAGYGRTLAFDLHYGAGIFGYDTRVEATTAAAPATDRTFTSTPAPAVVGVAKAGAVLRVRTGLWQPQAVDLAYRWNRDGRAIPGADGPAYTATERDRGARITVTVTGTKSGYAAVSLTSAPTPRVPVAAR